jgi:type I restriction enzyme S subunit
MTPAQFLEKFDLLSNLPNAVGKMRELILNLAVTGMLGSQNSGDDSAECVLNQIHTERGSALQDRRIGPMKPQPPIAEVEIDFQVPVGWIVARLAALVLEIQTGPFGSSLHQSDYRIGGTPVINPASLRNGRIVPIDDMAVGPDALKRLEVFRLSSGDIIMARRGEMGRCAIVTNEEHGWLCGTGSLVLRMPASLHAPYLAMFIGAPRSRRYLSSSSVGTTMQNLNQSILSRMPVGVPPLAEQKRIVAKVEELMGVVDRLEAQLAASREVGAKLIEAVVAELEGSRPSFTHAAQGIGRV